MIRNPLSVLLSWQSITAPVRKGQLPFAEAYDSALADRLRNEGDRIERQIIILDWYFQQYASLLQPRQIITYESIIESKGAVLAVVDPQACGLNEELSSRNRNHLYDQSLIQPLAERLLARRDHHFRNFYCDSDLDDLLADL